MTNKALGKTYQLKNWYWLDDAAKRLSETLDQVLTTAEVLDLCIEGHLPLSWYTRGVSARKVAPYTLLVGRGFSSELVEFDRTLSEMTNKTGLGAPDDGSPDRLEKYVGLWPSDGEHEIFALKGPYVLDLEICGGVRDWLIGLVTGADSDLVLIDGFILSDADGTLWQPVASTKADRDSYFPSGELPDYRELGCRRVDIEEFEQQLLGSTDKQLRPVGEKERGNLLRLIGSLLELMTGTESIQRTRPRFPSEEKIKNDIEAFFGSAPGLSKSQLNRVFPMAKSAIKEAIDD